MTDKLYVIEYSFEGKDWYLCDPILVHTKEADADCVAENRAKKYPGTQYRVVTFSRSRSR